MVREPFFHFYKGQVQEICIVEKKITGEVRKKLKIKEIFNSVMNPSVSLVYIK